MSLHMTLSGPRFREDRASGSRWAVTYGVGTLLQAAPGKVILIANRRINNKAAVDFEDGSDGFVFGSLEECRTATAVPLLRTEEATDPKTGEELWVVGFLVSGGFVPLGARLPDGTPHPAAGTGFAVATLSGVPRSGRHVLPVDFKMFNELIQLRYDGKALSVTGRRRIHGYGLLPGVMLRLHPLNAAIPDGADLLSGLVAGPVVRDGLSEPYRIPINHPQAHPILGLNCGCGMCRWRFNGAEWEAVDLKWVTGPDISVEPSLIRDQDGSLLMSVRGKGLKEPPGAVHEGLENTYEHFRVHRSRDNGLTWTPDLHLPRMRNATPVVLNRTAGGRPYLGANPYTELKTPQGKTIPSTMIRNTLALWPLTPDRRGVEAPVRVLDCTRQFGPPRPPSAMQTFPNGWNADHPVGNVCRLADGRWRNLLCFRVADAALNLGGLEAPAPGGLWIEEVTEVGETPIPMWHFQE